MSNEVRIVFSERVARAESFNIHDRRIMHKKSQLWLSFHWKSNKKNCFTEQALILLHALHDLLFEDSIRMTIFRGNPLLVWLWKDTSVSPIELSSLPISDIRKVFSRILKLKDGKVIEVNFFLTRDKWGQNTQIYKWPGHELTQMNYRELATFLKSSRLRN